ncbi:MAG TPA: AI-2E family transporter, partial [Armatimonadetes bacterium]|nr:AI-2E family transporter [Armatimonadota bacterium]
MRGLILAAVLAFVLWALVKARSVVAPFLVGLLLAYLLDPLVDKMEGRGFPRWAAIWMVFGGFLLLFALLALFIVPPLVVEVRGLAASLKGQMDKLPTLLKELGEWLSRLKIPGYLRRAIEDAASKAAQFVPAILTKLAVALMGGLSVLGWAVLVPVVTYYFLKEIDPLREAIWRACPEDYRPELKRAVGRVSALVGRYLRGLAIMCALNFALTWGVLSILRLKYALLVAIVTGLTYAIPYIGA